jgi:hypothetical protein
MIPSRSGPASGRRPACAVRATSSTASRTRRARCATASPVAVSRTRRVVRSTSRTPRLASNPEIAADTAGWLIRSAAAASRKLRLSAMATSARICGKLGDPDLLITQPYLWTPSRLISVLDGGAG